MGPKIIAQRRLVYRLWLFALLSAVLLMTARCTFKKNRPEHPFPSEARVTKSFFHAADNQGRARLKTFIAGWAPEMTAGVYGRAILDHYKYGEHMNVVFEIEENKIVGKAVIPSFIKEGQDCLLRDSEAAKACRARWPNIIEIPVKSHFYYERKKDARGRETDEYDENSRRSHWSARPEMNLDLSRTSIIDWGSDVLWPLAQTDAVTDVEWDNQRGFLAFTIEARNHEAFGGSFMQGKFRYNFLEFKHDPSFKITPYRHANARFLNVLHVVGKEVDGDPTNPVLYAARWDTRRKHEIYLYGFPKEYEQIGIDVIEEWNDAFEKVGHGRPFIAKVTDRKYAFDLRYNTITWVDDRRLSAYAPLGVGMALADVRNGNIQWGGVTVWGGMLQEYINRNSSNSSTAADASDSARPIVQLGLMDPKRMLPGTQLALPDSLLGLGSYESIRNDLAQQFGQEKEYLKSLYENATPAQIQQLAQTPTESDVNPINQLAESLSNPQGFDFARVRESLGNSISHLDGVNQSVVDRMATGLAQVAQRLNIMATQVGPLEKVYSADFVQDLMGMPKLEESLAHLPYGNARDWNKLVAQGQLPRLSKEKMIELIMDRKFPTRTGQSTLCADRHFADVADSWSVALSQANVDKVEAMRQVIKDLLLHEVGHMLGLGHNFKENILPVRGTVPNVSTKLGLYEPFKYDDLEAKAKDRNRNYTTVMGYKDGAIDIIVKYDELKPGPGDILSLEYLYNQRYPIYPTDAKGAGDIEFARLTNDGWILESLAHKGKTYRPAYFPACNDFDASLGMDPYCARWDRGYNASTIVQNHFDSYRGNLISSLTAFTDTVKGDAFWAHEYGLWIRSLMRFGRARVFYDYMRQKYEPQIRQLIASGSETGIQNLLQFGETCRAMSEGKPVENKTLESTFRSYPEMLDLCVATGITIDELTQLLQLPGKDYTQLDYRNRYVSFARGGEARTSFSRAWGTWKELARVPIKFTALMTLASPMPFVQIGGWAIPILQYARQDGSYHLSTLFAKQYSNAVAAATEMNLNFGDGGLDQTTSIGRTVMAMGYYLRMPRYSNDVLQVGAPFVKNITDQSAFRYSLAVIDVERENEEGKQIGRKFTGTIYNMYQRGPEKVPELYIYTNDRIMLRPPPGSLIMPVTPLRWYSKSGGYFYAIKMDYSDEFFDRLKTNSVRRTLNETYQDVVKKCIQGENKNGLRFFFNNDVDEKVFPGFEFPDTIAERDDSRNRFLRSVQLEFENYYLHNAGGFSPAPNPAQCEEAIRGQSLIVMAASVLNGYYFFDLYDYLEKGN